MVAVTADLAIPTRSVASLLIATTRAMAAGMAVDRGAITILGMAVTGIAIDTTDKPGYR